MVTRRHLAPAFALGAAGLCGACNFSVYDDLADEAWVDRVERPGSTDSRKYGEAIVATPGRTDGTNVVVIGTSRASISQLRYDAEGKRGAIQAIDPRENLNFATFPDNPALAVDADSDRIALTVVQGENNDPTLIAVLDGSAIDQPPVKKINLTGQVTVGGMLRNNITAEGVTFASLPGVGMDQDDLVVTRGPQLLLVQDYAQPDMGSSFQVRGCLHGEDWSYAVAVADILPDATHVGPEIIVGVGSERRDGPSKLLVLDPAVISAPYEPATADCLATEPLATYTSSEGARDLGQEIIAAQFPDTAEGDPTVGLSDLVYSSPGLNKVFVRFGSGTVVELAAPEGAAEFGDALATGDLDGDGVPELVIGAPRSNPEGVTNGGSVYVYEFQASPPGFTMVETLYPGEPENEERFGKSVTIAPFGTGTRNVLVVGAEGEVFTYFRTQLYSDVRAGRESSP